MFREFLARHKKPLGVIAISSFVFIILGLYVAFRDVSPLINYERLNALVESGEIKRAVMSNKYIYIYTDKGSFSTPNNDRFEELVLRSTPIEHSFEFLPFLLFSVVSFSVFAVIWKVASRYLNKRVSYSVIKSGGAKQKEDAQTEPEQVYEVKGTLKFTDIAGVDEAKAELEEIVEFLKNPKLFKSKNIHIPKGALLIGPPGVGKTLLARAVAGESGAPFFYKSAATFVELYVGVGAKRVSELFLAAKRKAPSIIFIDEIDAIGSKRGGISGERESTLNQLLVEMDGFEGNSGVIVIAATNKLEALDEALLRAGRFDRRIFVELPDIKGREEILKIYLKHKRHSVEPSALAKYTTGFSGASLSSLTNEAAINALKRGSETIDEIDFTNARSKVLYGSKRIAVLGERELDILSVYQAAKLLFGVKNSLDISFISQIEIRVDEGILEYKGAKEITKLVDFSLVGRAATREIFGETYYHSKTDYEKAKKIAKEILFAYRLTIEEYETPDRYIQEREKSLDVFARDNRELILKLSVTLREDRHFELSKLKEKGVL
ncbi:MAG TPA: ATP-dependent metallopeptidase FtsH/Yme1/Tma family protein [Campylobacterales bacterium]|nr:ATP-dependent metallopeptidase FtsH/Yme1/Tma family protein [Campylobacterales bacterium]